MCRHGRPLCEHGECRSHCEICAHEGLEIVEWLEVYKWDALDRWVDDGGAIAQ